jgi:hypothetical protein
MPHIPNLAARQENRDKQRRNEEHQPPVGKPASMFLAGVHFLDAHTHRVGLLFFQLDGARLVPEDAELRVEVQRQEAEACESGARVAGREAHLRLAQGVGVAAAHVRRVLHVCGALADGAEGRGDGRVAEGEEVWAEAADEPFDEGLEEGGCGEGVAEADALFIVSVGGNRGIGGASPRRCRPRSC